MREFNRNKGVKEKLLNLKSIAHAWQNPGKKLDVGMSD